LVVVVELAEGDGGPGKPVVIAGGDGGGPFDDGGGDRVVPGSVPAPPDSFGRVRVTGEHGGLGPQGGIPRPPEPAVPVPEDRRVIDVGGEPALRVREIAAVQREQGVEGGCEALLPPAPIPAAAPRVHAAPHP